MIINNDLSESNCPFKLILLTFCFMNIFKLILVTSILAFLLYLTINCNKNDYK